MNACEINKDYDFEVNAASYIGQPEENTVMYVTKKVAHLIDNLFEKKHCLIFAEAGIIVPDELLANNCFVFTGNPQLEYTRFVQKLADKVNQSRKERKFTLTDGGYYVGEDVIIGENAWIEPTCVIGHDVTIGKNAQIFAGTKIRNSIVGDNFIANENCVIGTYGFTMAVDENGNKIRIPTLGKVVIGNNVEIGALDNISVGSGGNTVIDDNVKLDALIYVGHNDYLGKNTEVPAGVIIGGFVNAGENTYIGVNASIRNRLSLGENCVIGMGSVVTKSVPENVTIAGNPARLFKKST